MLIASLSVGDLMLTLHKHCPLDREEALTSQAYVLTFTDMATDRRSYAKSVQGEAHALALFAAWIVADGADMEALIKELYADPALVQGKYLP